MCLLPAAAFQNKWSFCSFLVTGPPPSNATNGSPNGFVRNLEKQRRSHDEEEHFFTVFNWILRTPFVVMMHAARASRTDITDFGILLFSSVSNRDPLDGPAAPSPRIRGFWPAGPRDRARIGRGKTRCTAPRSPALHHSSTSFPQLFRQGATLRDWPKYDYGDGSRVRGWWLRVPESRSPRSLVGSDLSV